MIRKLTNVENRTEGMGLEKRILRMNPYCITNCIPYCGGLRDVAFDISETVSA